jgi:acyl carrier protein
MGLDSVELVIEIEDRFNVTLPDAECQRVRTVADLAVLVLSRLPHDNGVCPTAHAFYEFRRLAVTHAGLKREHVRPKATLTAIFPPSSRRRWNLIRKKDRRLPSLVASPRAATALLCAGTIAASACLLATAALWESHGVSAAIPFSFITLITCLASFRIAAVGLARHFPAKLQTIADLTRLIAPLRIQSNSPGQNLLAQQRVLQEVRRLTAEQVGLPLEKVQPTSDLVNDLEFD